MLRKVLFLALAAALGMLLSSSRAHAWGAMHVGFTHYGAGGFYHTGRTVGVGPYGGVYSYGRTGYGYGGYGGVYHSAYGYGYGGYHPTYYGAYGAAGYHSAYGYTNGVYAGGYRAGSVWVP